MRTFTRLALLLGLALPAAGQQSVAPRVVMPAVPIGAAVAGAALRPVLPTLASPLALPPALAPTLPSAMPALAAPVAAAAAVAPAAPRPAAAGAAQPLRVILMGAPGAGKTTYGKMLAADYGAVHISVGELLRAYAKDHPDVAALMQRGDLVDSALVLRAVRERLSQDDVRRRGYILDGFPRRLEEAVPLEGWLSDVGLDAVVHLEVPEAELRRRIQARGRADDNDATFANRMRVYRRQTQPVIDRFRAGVGVLEPDVSGPDPEANYARLRSILEDAVPRLTGR